MADTGRKPSSTVEAEQDTDSNEVDTRKVDTYIPPARSGVSFSAPLPKAPRIPSELND